MVNEDTVAQAQENPFQGGELRAHNDQIVWQEQPTEKENAPTEEMEIDQSNDDSL